MCCTNVPVGDSDTVQYLFMRDEHWAVVALSVFMGYEQ